MDKQVSFTEMSKSTPEDYEIVMEHARDFVSKLPDRILAHLELLKGCLLYTSDAADDP